MRGLMLLAVLLVGVNAQVLDDSKQINVDGCGRRPFEFNAVNLTEKILGGQIAALGSWGWQVAIFLNGRFICGGSLINSQWILTAAHCVFSNNKPTSYSILIGANNRVNPESWSIQSTVSYVTDHPAYNPSTLRNDIGLIKLSSPVSYSNYVIPVCIDDGSINYVGYSAWAAGWGSLSFQGSYPAELYDVQMNVLSVPQCSSSRPTLEVCAAGSNEGTGICQGDSGGPLVIKNPENGKWYSHGVTSYSIVCGKGVFTRTSAYNKWIRETIGKN